MQKVRTKYAGQIRYWALIVSIALHMVALGVFAGVKLSSRIAEAKAERPMVSMEMIRRAVEQPQPKPKPKVKPVEKKVKPVVEQEKTPLVTPETAPKPEPVEESEFIEPEVGDSMPAPSLNEVEFFGQKSIVRHICYVVDCSGSMYGQMYRFKNKLVDSVKRLNAEQSFAILFFMDGQQILMTGSGRLEPATAKAKSEALKLIAQVRPAGSTDALHALECAMRLRAPDGGAPEVIYFLTDGFNLDDGSAALFVEKVDRFRKSLAPTAVMHTIGFWPQKRDKQMLKTLARRSGGKYTEAEVEKNNLN